MTAPPEDRDAAPADGRPADDPDGRPPEPRLDGPTPVDVDVDREHGVTVTWADGRVTHHPLLELRRSCTCATCRGRREQGRSVGPAPGEEADLSIVDAELVGAWGMSFRWNDGHDTGIYAWEHLSAMGHEGS